MSKLSHTETSNSTYGYVCLSPPHPPSYSGFLTRIAHRMSEAKIRSVRYGDTTTLAHKVSSLWSILVTGTGLMKLDWSWNGFWRIGRWRSVCWWYLRINRIYLEVGPIFFAIDVQCLVEGRRAEGDLRILEETKMKNNSKRQLMNELR